MNCPDVVRVTVPSGPSVVRVAAPSAPALVRVATPGLPGPPGLAGANDLTTNTTVDMTGVVNGSTLVYSSATGKFVANATTTVSEILNGGNF